MSQYRGKKIAIIGLSVEGSDAVKFFVSENADITCFDRRTKEELGDIFTKLSTLPVTFSLGKEYLANLSSYDIIVRSPGVALWTPELVTAKKNGSEITSLTKLFFDECKAPIIGVTGTKGKGTTSTLIYDMLKKDRKTVYLGGNVGQPLLSVVRSIQPTDWVVLELSSFQLEDLTKSPHIAVVLAITQDHLANSDVLASNYHKNRDAYIQAKKSIVRFQSRNDILIVNKHDPISSNLTKESPATSFAFTRYDSTGDAYVENHTVYVKNTDGSRETICSATDVRVRGDHNLEDICAAVLAGRAAGVGVSVMKSTAREFPGLPYRLEQTRVVGGVTYINDSFSTIPETTIAAIQSFTSPIILIVGGSEKKSDFDQLGKEIQKSTVKKCIVIGDMTERIVASLKKAGYTGPIITGLSTMHSVVEEAHSNAVPGDVVLLSPACASFGMFKNYKDRGDQFTYEVTSLR